jgi:hypothetical protein
VSASSFGWASGALVDASSKGASSEGGSTSNAGGRQAEDVAKGRTKITQMRGGKANTIVTHAQS